MSLWRNVRAETAGAWRSLCYDLGRRPEARRGGVPDVTSTGMSTFPGSLISLPAEPVADHARPPRRSVAVAAFCALAAFGAAGSYLMATTAFAGRMTDPPAAVPEVAVAPRPPAFEAGPAPAHDGGDARMGGPRHRPRATSPAPAAPVVTTTTHVVTTPAPNPPTRENTRPAGPVTTPPECDCDTPPVPTPTVPPATVPASVPPSMPADPGASAPSFGDGVWIPLQ